MTDKDQLIKMLEKAKIQYHISTDNILSVYFKKQTAFGDKNENEAIIDIAFHSNDDLSSINVFAEDHGNFYQIDPCANCIHREGMSELVYCRKCEHFKEEE